MEADAGDDDSHLGSRSNPIKSRKDAERTAIQKQRDEGYAKAVEKAREESLSLYGSYFWSNWWQ